MALRLDGVLTKPALAAAGLLGAAAAIVVWTLSLSERVEAKAERAVEVHETGGTHAVTKERLDRLEGDVREIRRGVDELLRRP